MPPLATLRRLFPRQVRVAVSAQLAERNSARLQRELAAMASNPAPIVAGPWLGEVGFELLYWVPFLAWFAERFNVDPERLVVLSRGGSASWCGSFARRFSDVFDQVTPEAFHEQHDARVREIGEQKQTRMTAFEHGLIQGVADRVGTRNWSLLHPSRMYDVLNPYWWGHLQTDWVHRHTRYRRLPAPGPSGIADLPESYVAVKFYFNECFPPTDHNRAFARDVIRRLAADGPVVALSTGLEIDDHDGYRVDVAGVRLLPEGIDPARNLQVQSAVVARARAFVGTYGGFSYLAPFYGVRSVAFFSNRQGYSAKHLTMVGSALETLGSSNLLHVSDVAEGVASLAAIEPAHG